MLLLYQTILNIALAQANIPNQKAVGHHSFAMTIRYARLSPEHLQETRKLNPISALKHRHSQPNQTGPLALEKLQTES